MKKIDLGSRLLSLLLAVVMLLSMLPTYEVRTNAQQELSATVTVLSSGGVWEGNTVVFREVELDFIPANNTTGFQDGWWVGIKAIAPESLNMELATYQSQTSTGWSAAKSFKSDKDSDDDADEAYIELWDSINGQHLNAAKLKNENVRYGYRFDWDGDGEYEDVFGMEVDPASTTLKKDGKVVYPVAEYYAAVKALSEVLQISGSQSAVVTAQYGQATALDWMAADASIGRGQDGWGLGIEVIAPVGVDLSAITYQNKMSDGWGAAKSFDQNKNTENSIYLWGMVNEEYLTKALIGQKKLNECFRFDWNGDGTYEQEVTLVVDPKLVVLRDANGEQVYPCYGSLTPLTGGKVTGQNDALTLTVEEVVLEWSEADPSIGRLTDGWWVGALVTAPEGYTAQQLEKATYKRRATSSVSESGWGEYQKVNFADVRDNDTQVQIWIPLTQELVDNYVAREMNIASECIFDWNADGKDDQTVMLSIIPSEKIVLNKVEQAEFCFQNPYPHDIWVGNTFENPAIGGSGDGSITYSIVSGKELATIDPETGIVTFKKVGTVVVQAVKAGTSVYKEAVATYTVNSIRTSPTGEFGFANSTPIIKVGFAEGTFTNIASGGTGTGKVTYHISDGKGIATIDENTGKVTFEGAGQVTVEAVKEEDELYFGTSDTYILVIEKSDQQTITVKAPAVITYSTEAQNVLRVSGGSGDGVLTYAITAGDEYAAIDAETGAITTKKAGGSITVTVTKSGTNGYHEAVSEPVTIYIEKAQQKQLSFQVAEPEAITYDSANNVFDNKATGGSGTGKITYGFAKPTEVATIDRETGRLTILAAGEVTVVATKAADDCYRSQQAQYVLKINRNTPDFEVEDLDLIFGVEQHKIEIKENRVGPGGYVYTIGDLNEIHASVTQDGVILFDVTKAVEGAVQIKVQKQEDHQYTALEKTMTVQVSFLETDAKPTVSGEKKNDSVWYTDKITITPPAGYQIIYSDELNTRSWSDALIYHSEGTDGRCYVHLRNEEGITAPIAVEGLLLDKSAPMDLEISYTTSAWERVLAVVTFGYYNPTGAVVTLKAKDTVSGIAYFTCNYGKEKVAAEEMTLKRDGSMEYSFVVDSDYRGHISFTAADVAGWETVFVDDKMLVVDLTAPELNVMYEYDGKAREEEKTIYTNGKVNVRLEITERNFDLSLIKEEDRPQVKLDGNTLLLNWSKSGEDVWVGQIPINNPGIHNVEIDYTDLSKNETVTYSKTIVFSETAPELQIQYSGTHVRDQIYSQSVIGTVTVKENNFNATDMKLTVSAVDITGEKVDLSRKNYEAYAANPANWKTDDSGGVHTLVLPTFDVDAIYTVDLDYTNLNGTPAVDYIPDVFTVDKEAPSKITIEYSEPLKQKIFNILGKLVTFGFYKEKVTVTVTAEDITSGVQSVVVGYRQQDGKNNSNKTSYVTEKLLPVQNQDSKKLFTASVELDAQARGSVMAYVMDHADHEAQGTDDRILVLDTQVPKLDVSYEFETRPMQEYQGIFYTQGNTNVQFTIEEANFDLSLLTAEGKERNEAPVVSVNGDPQSVTWMQIQDTDKWIAETQLTGNGDYVVSIAYADPSGNLMQTYTQEVRIDNVVPEIQTSYEMNGPVHQNCYGADHAMGLKILEHNFKPEHLELVVTAETITGKMVDLSSKEYSSKIKNPANWSQNGDVWTLDSKVLVFDIDGKYELSLDYADPAGNEAMTYSREFVVDKTAPENIEISYSKSVADRIFAFLGKLVSHSFYRDKATVTVTADDMTSGVEYFLVEYLPESGNNHSNKPGYVSQRLQAVPASDRPEHFSATLEIDPDLRGSLKVTAVDRAGNETQHADGVVLVLDTGVPGLEVEYDFTNQQMREYENIYYTQGDTTVRFIIKEANFDLSLLTATDEAQNEAPVVTVNGKPQVVTWEQIPDTDTWIGELLLSGNGDYVVAISYADRSGNAMSAYSQEIHIDNVDPVIDVTYDYNEARNENCYNANRAAAVVITEHNFLPKEVELTVTAKDITGAEVDISAKEYTKKVCDPANWIKNGDMWILNPKTMLFDLDAIYTVTLSYKDLAENGPVVYETEFVIDHTAPSNIKIEYKEPVAWKVFNILGKALTFGLFNQKAVVTVTAQDMTAGVEYVKLTYSQEPGSSKVNAEDFETQPLAVTQNPDRPYEFSVSYTIPAQVRGKVSAEVCDRAGNTVTSYDNRTLVVDDKTPGLKVEYDFTNHQMREYENIYYTQGNTTVRFIIEEANFDLSLLTATDEAQNEAPMVTVNGKTQTVTWEQIPDTDTWIGELLLSGDGDYVVAISYADRTGNAMNSYSQEIHIDDVDPVIAVTYDNNKVRNENCYNANRKATVVITEHNFLPQEVELTVTARDITGAKVDISAKEYTEKACDPANWSKNGDVWTLNPETMLFDLDAIYTVTLSYKDLAQNGPVVYETEFVIDHTAPEIISITYSDPVSVNYPGFYSKEMTVKVTVEDMTAGVEYIKIFYTKEENSSMENKPSYDTGELTATQDPNQPNVFTVSCSVEAQARGTLRAEVCDSAGNVTKSQEGVTVVLDTKIPILKVTLDPLKILDAGTLMPPKDGYKEGDVILYYQKQAVLTFAIKEANFDLSLLDDARKPVVLVKKGDVTQKVTVVWEKSNTEPDTYVAQYIIEGDGDYVVSMTYADPSNNAMTEYISSKIAIDGKIPEIKTKYQDGKDHQEKDNVKFYPATQNLLVQITEHNFRADDVVVNVTGHDIQGKEVDVAAFNYSEYAKTRENWISEGDVHTLNTEGMVFSTDAIYTFDITYADIIGNKAANYPGTLEEDRFVVDHAGPTNLRIEYSPALDNQYIAPDHYGFYQSEVIVTLTAEDVTAGVDYFRWDYNKQKDASNINAQSYGAKINVEDISSQNILNMITYSNDGLTATTSFKIPAQARGHISMIAVDRAGNASELSADHEINVVDSIGPEVKVDYQPTEQTTAIQYVDAAKETVETFEQAAYAFYNGSVTATVSVNEANFFEGTKTDGGVLYQVGLLVTRTDDLGQVTRTEYLPQGAEQRFADAQSKPITWQNQGDVHTAQIVFEEDGDYVLDLVYTDHSNNLAKISGSDGFSGVGAYTSKPVTVDGTAPVVAVAYGNADVIHTIDGRSYFAAPQSAVITVVEHNFRPSDFLATVEAVDILGQSIATENFAASLSNPKNWTTNGNVHTAAIHYPVEANYTFSCTMQDLAQNVSADYAADLFTVDMTAPKNLTVKYSTSVLEKVLQSITFGYYNAQMKVTITAEDDVSGVLYFVYSYIKSQGVSGVNAQLLDQRLEEANNHVVRNGKTSTASFMVPKNLLKNDNQFNGTVQFTAYDRSENNTLKADAHRIVVDNIKPTATVTYNAPVQKANNISYYMGNINAQIKVNEANFYKEDVLVKVNGQPVNVQWVDNSTDLHTGSFSITKDGNYVVTVSYKDRSNNEMATYTSNTMTIDTVAPVVEVSNIKNNSANKDEQYSFTITATDTNMDAATFAPVLTATVRNEDGTYGIKTVSLGSMKTLEKGKVYSFTVEDLPEDAVYILKCTVQDMSGNQHAQLMLSDDQVYDQVSFSINRNGSTFTVDQNTNDLTQQYYVCDVNSDVVLEEINVDPVEKYTVRLNGQDLTEGQDYTTTLTSREGEWSKRSYVISKDVFAEEGEYNVVLETQDKTNTTAFSDVKNLNVSFVVDRTAPALTITGLQEGGRYQIDQQVVTVIPTDDGGRLNSMKVTVLDPDGNPLKDESNQDISVRFEMSGEEFLKYLNENDGEVVFTVPEVLEHQVVITCNDCAVDAEGKTNECLQVFKKVTVSQSGWIIFYAYKPVFYGTIGGVVLALGLTIFLIVLKRKKQTS